MKINELKKALKPLIKECIKETIFEEGVLSGIISEVMKGVNTVSVIKEEKAKPMFDIKGRKRSRNKVLEGQRKQMLDAIGKGAFNGVNVFEGVEPALADSSPHDPLSNIQPGDPGVDISGLFNSNWSKMI